MSRYLTDFGVAIEKNAERHLFLLDYYDTFTGNICIPLEVFLSDDDIRKDAFSLLESENLVNFDANWCLTRSLIGDEDGELIEGVVLTAIQNIFA